MQEWIIAMLVISILLVLRDMAKTILSGRKSAKNAEVFALCENHPRKEKVEKYAESFQKLADSFYGMPYRRDRLSSGQIDHILRDASEELCAGCYHREICWENQSKALRQGRRGHDNGPWRTATAKRWKKIRLEWAEICGKSTAYLAAVKESFGRERQKLIWDNRMIESRLAVAQQLTEMSGIMQSVAEGTV